MNYKIITNQDALRVVSRDTCQNEVDELDLITNLREANRFAWINGCGLAAIQIGIPLRFAWFNLNDKEDILLNPKIVTRIGRQTLSEGCLSIPNKWFPVERAVEIEYITNRKKKRAKGFKARLIQHEIDHMDGILINEL